MIVKKKTRKERDVIQFDEDSEHDELMDQGSGRADARQPPREALCDVNKAEFPKSAPPLAGPTAETSASTYFRRRGCKALL
ncbi:unnamed protein product, partial [Iphiclides podalirius]